LLPGYRRDDRFWSFLECPPATDLLFNLTRNGSTRDACLQQCFDPLFLPLLNAALPLHIDADLSDLSASRGGSWAGQSVDCGLNDQHLGGLSDFP
jgi:hypothetical protein